MFGLEKKEYQPFEFDLEKELRKDRKKLEDARKMANEKIKTIKDMLRGGEEKKNFDNLGLLLHGYTALNKVLDQIEHSK